jgi:hypothetical protein
LRIPAVLSVADNGSNQQKCGQGCDQEQVSPRKAAQKAELLRELSNAPMQPEHQSKDQQQDKYRENDTASDNDYL